MEGATEPAIVPEPANAPEPASIPEPTTESVPAIAPQPTPVPISEGLPIEVDQDVSEHLSYDMAPNSSTETPAQNQDHDDSAYDSETASFTTSLASSVVNYKEENGRRYHAYREGAYVFPNDEQEQERLDLTHRLIMLALEERLYTAPINKDPKRILDLGTGTGIWAIEIADEFPNAAVIGNDLSAIQPKWVPPNLTFEVDDIESEWSYSGQFDFIHSRHLDFAIADWGKLARQCYQFTKPGGWCEWQEFDYHWYSDDDTFKKGSPIQLWSEELFAAAEKMGKVPCPGLVTEKFAHESGFINVSHKIHKAPLGPWAKDKRLKEMGAFNLAGLLEGLEGFSIALYTRVLGYSVEKVQTILADVRAQLRNPKIHAMINIHVVYGQKPGDPSSSD